MNKEDWFIAAMILAGPAIFLISVFMQAEAMEEPPPSVVKNQYGVEYYVLIIDGCQYIAMKKSGHMSHKGNCSNPIHIYNTEAVK